MIAFGVCVGSDDRYAAHAGPRLEALRERHLGDVLVMLESDPASIAAAYNRLLDRARRLDGCEGLVLLHEDVELRDADALAKLRAALAAPGAGVVGVVGASGAKGLAWWEAPVRRGQVVDARTNVDFGRGAHDVETLDGLLLALSPAALATARLPEQPGWHGYDAELCAATRAAGLAVRTIDLDVYHASQGGYGDKAAFDAADAAFRRRWRGPASGECPACGAALPARAGTAPVEIVVCPACGLGATCPAPRRDVAGAGIFDEVYAGARLARRAQWFEEARARLAWVETHAHAGPMLEAGCATGEFVALAKARGWDARGIEPSTWAADRARELGCEVPWPALAAARGAAPEGAFGAIAAWHCLEHVLDPRGWLRDARALLRPGGWLLLEVPNFAARDAVADPVGWTCASVDDHAWHFTVDALLRLLNREGFSQQETRAVSYRVYDGATAWERRVAAWRAAGHAEPSLDLLRVAARVRP